jgi:hypothetical protein
MEVSGQLHAMATLPLGIGGWVDPRAFLDDAKKKNYCPYWVSNSGSLVVQPVARRYTV